MMRQLFITTLFCFLVIAVYAQQPLYSHYMFNSIGFNPAFAGNKDQFVLQSSYRMQWQNIEGAPQSLILSTDGPVYKDKLAIGVDLNNDRIGDQSITTAYFSVAYRLKLNDLSRLSFGLAGGAESFQIDKNKLLEQDPGDTYLQQIESQYITPDVRAGIYFSSYRLYAGVSAINLLSSEDNNPEFATENKQTEYLFTAGYLYQLGKDVNIYPSVLYKEDFTTPSSLTTTLLFQFNRLIWTGVAYHAGFNALNTPQANHINEVSNGISVLFDLELNERFRFGYAYDHTFSDLYTGMNSHEISLSYYFGGRKHYRIMNPRYL